MNNFQELTNDQMNSLKGGRRKVVRYTDIDGDGVVDVKVTYIYDNQGLKKVKTKYL